MSTSTAVPSPPDAASFDGAETTQDSVVLERIAARVQLRMAAEQEASNVDGGGHPASLIWPWPL